MDDCYRVAGWRRGLFRGLAIAATAVLGACGGSGEDPSATVRFVHHFSALDGAAYYPASGLTQAPDGHFYGVSFAGGSADLGTLYRLTPDEKVEVRHAFQGGASGALPNGDLVLAEGGQALYGTTAMAGEGPSTAFRWSLSGQFSAFGYLGTHLSNTYNSGLVAGSDGNLHVATEYEWVSITPGGTQTAVPFDWRPVWGIGDLVAGEGGTYVIVGRHDGAPSTLEFVSHDGLFTPLFTFDGVSPVGQGPQGLMRARDGSLRGYTRTGGAHGHGALFRATVDGAVTRVADLSTPLCGPLTEAQDGQWYGFVCDGDATAIGRIAATGEVARLHTFSGARLTPFQLLEHRPNRFYGVTWSGGNHRLGSIYEMVVTP